ncbi:carbonic anhydrase [Microvirga puerhi]|uniref:carbonic anhydrase n=1 Tax=Microvirga puerhi TaxID=2876078 RepID=A0ABS7VPQ4_9HYPH|nr:carbonic anhydrase [Microvirga puerhi]MBZ6077095.1 carbonic anhydrase [Microvirga puerhi]
MCDTCSAGSAPHLSRRGLLMAGAGMAVASGLALKAGSAFAQTTPQNAISGDDALKRIMDGNARYVANTPEQKDFSAGRAARTQSQHPIAAIVSCSDSRVAPEFAFDQNPGDLFVVRVAGNFVNDDGLASLEFGTQFLGAPLILVLGHTSCGALVSAVKVVNEGLELPGHLPDLIGALKPAVEAAKKENASDLAAAAIVANVKLNVERLKNASPILKTRVAEKKLLVAGGVYDLATGKVSLV